jgi:hypothetical protein
VVPTFDESDRFCIFSDMLKSRLEYLCHATWATERTCAEKRDCLEQMLKEYLSITQLELISFTFRPGVLSLAA